MMVGCTSEDIIEENQVLSQVNSELEELEVLEEPEEYEEVEDLFRLVTTDDYSQTTLYVEEFNQARSFELQAIVIDDQHYLVIEDFVELGNKINSGYSMIKRLRIDNLNQDTGVLEITYNKGMNYNESGMSYILNSASVKVASVTIEGEDLTLPIHVSSHGVIDENGTVYLPVYLFNYYIFDNAAALYRYEENAYKIITNSWYTGESFMKEHSPYYPQTSYHTTHAITEDYLRNAFGYSGPYTTSKT